MFAAEVAGELDLDALGREARDGVLPSYLFLHVPRQRRDAVAREIHALLAPGGGLVVQEHSVRGRSRVVIVGGGIAAWPPPPCWPRVART